METFTFFWMDGRRTMCMGETPVEALTRVGYGVGAIRAIDFYTNGDNKEYIWNPDIRSWIRRSDEQAQA